MKPKSSHILTSINATDSLGLVQKTGAFWEHRLGRPVSAEEAREIIQNIVGYFTLLAEWESAEKNTMNSDDSSSSTSNFITDLI